MSNLLLLAAFTENKGHSVNNQSRFWMSILCVCARTCVCIKGCLFQMEIEFEESNLIRGHRSLEGQLIKVSVVESLVTQQGANNDS